MDEKWAFVIRTNDLGIFPTVTHKLGNTAINIIPRSSEKHTTQIKGMQKTQHYPLYSLAIIGTISGSWRSSSKKNTRFTIKQRYPNNIQ